MQHPAHSLPDWNHLTTGKPSRLFESSFARSLNQRVAILTGTEATLTGTTTFHLYWDMIAWLGKMNIQVYFDEFAYPISTWLINSSLRHRKSVIKMPHHDVTAFTCLAKAMYKKGHIPVLFADGYCPLSGQIFPANEFIPVLERYNGLLILDDTQGIGIFGNQSHAQSSRYGSGGGGILRWQNINSPRVVLISSLAKAFGAPVATLSGSLSIVDAIANASLSAIHCSPASNAHLLAALHALDLNDAMGNQLRRKLASRVTYFRQCLGSIRKFMLETYHPFQTIILPSQSLSYRLISFLKKYGIDCIHHRYMNKYTAVSMIIQISHRFQDILYLARMINRFFDGLNLHEERSHHEYDAIIA